MTRILPAQHGHRWVVDAGTSLRVPEGLFVEDAPPDVVTRALQSARAEQPRRFSATVLTTQDCNLACAYCIQNTTADPVTRISAATMGADGAAQAADYIRARSEGYDGTNLLLFGGEPLMAVDAGVALLEDVHPAWSGIWTNGVLLAGDRLQRLVDAGLDHVYVTFDGGPATHYLTRSNKAGKDTYRLIVDNVLRAAARYPHLAWRIRSSFLPGSVVDSHHQLVADLADLPGLAEGASWDLGLIDDIGIGFDHVAPFSERVAEHLIELNRVARGAGFAVGVRAPLTDCPYCGTTTDGVTIDADGTLYSCWQTAGRVGHQVGHIGSGLDSQLVKSRWVRCDFNVTPHGTPGEQARFWDRVDQDILDANAGVGEYAVASG